MIGPAVSRSLGRSRMEKWIGNRRRGKGELGCMEGRGSERGRCGSSSRSLDFQRIVNFRILLQFLFHS